MLELIRKSYSSEIKDWRDLKDKNLAYAEVRHDKLASFLRSIRFDPQFEMQYLDLFSLSLIENQISLRYFLRSSLNSQVSLIVKSSLAFDREVFIESASELWPNIAFYEQEYSVLYGIKFSGLVSSKLFTPVFLREFPFAPESTAGGFE